MITKMKLRIGLENRLVRTLRDRLPYESCGLLYGTETSGIVDVLEFRLVRNAAATPETDFSFHPEDWTEAYYEAKKNQREIVGLFHSHPSGNARPSESDYAGFVPWRTYWIIGLSDDVHEIGVFMRGSDERWATLPLQRLP